jgi:aromatic-L-amino-acid/L-tryptophan decarboxylase
MSRRSVSRQLPLDLNAAQRAQLAQETIDMIERLLGRRDRAPIFVPTPPRSIEAMAAAPPELGLDAPALLDRVLAVAECGWSKAHAGDLGFIPNGNLYSGVVAAMLAAGLHTFTGSAWEQPGLVALEESVLRWLAGVFGMPLATEGLLLSGGSLANQTAIVAARDRGDFAPDRCVAYLSERAHHSLTKAMHLCGIPGGCIRSIRATPQGRIDTRALRDVVERDEQLGRRPWLIIGVAGSTDTGSIDDLEELAAVALRHGAWLHVDAAYGGMFALTQRGATRLQGIEAADSVVVDAHKGLFLPYGVAAVLVRHPGALARAHAGQGAYMRDVPHLPDLPNYFERGPELTRPFRGLLIWLPLHLHGVASFRHALDRSLDLAQLAAARLRAIPGVEVLHEPELSIVAFSAVHGDATTQRILAAINESGRLRVSSTTIQGRVAIRLAFLHPRTGEAQIDDVDRIVRQALETQ